jgi:hypothetical protein
MEPRIDKQKLRAEVDANYDFLQRRLASFLPDHAGEYALLRSRELIGFFAKPGQAYREGLSRFSDGIFSIQEVTAEPLDLGFFSYAGA